jgi:hypothetical protein
MTGELVATPDAPTISGTLFVSYARADDEQPPFDKNALGWITFFWHQLRYELADAGVSQAAVWLDRYQIDPAEDFTKRIEAALGAAQLVIMVLSPNWAQRPWCLQEALYFAGLHPDAIDRTVIVKKRDLPAGMRLPDAVNKLLENREGYRFFEKEPTGDIREFYWRGLKDEKAYYDVLKKMARWIADRMVLYNAPPPPRPAPPSKGKTIFLAPPADELRDTWQRLANDLEGSGYEVLPNADRLPDTAQSLETLVRDALAKAALSVHFLGDSEGMKPDGSEETITRLQLRLARERDSAGAPFTRILWAPKWLADRSKGKRDPFQVVGRFGGLQPHEELYAEEVTDLSQWLRGRLEFEEKGEAGSPDNGTRSFEVQARPLLIASAHAEDDELAASLANCVQSPEVKVSLACAGDAIPPGETAAIVPWGIADKNAIFALLTAMEPIKPTILRLPGGDEDAKRRFFRDGVYAETISALPRDRKAARDLLARLDILPAVGTNVP